MADLPGAVAAAAAPPSPVSGAGGACAPQPARPAPPPPPARRKLRLLALHGFGQDAEAFRSRSGSWRKGLKARAELFYVDAPFPAPSGGGRSWWGWEGGGDNTGAAAAAAAAASPRPSRSDRPIAGWDQSRSAILTALADHAPIDGLLGFSQGAAAAAWVASELASGAAPYPPGVSDPLRCVILAAPFIPRDAKARAAFAAAAGTPPQRVLFIAGASDEAVPPARTEEVAAVWFGRKDDGTWLRHPGGHCLPTCSGGVKAEIGAFLDGVGFVDQTHRPV